MMNNIRVINIIALLLLLTLSPYRAGAFAFHVRQDTTITIVSRAELEQMKKDFEKAQADSMARIQAYNDSLLREEHLRDSLKNVNALNRAREDSIARSFNALRYSRQKRYRPLNEEFVSEKWIDNTFVSAHIGTNTLIDRDEKSTGFGPEFRVSYGKWLNENNAVRTTLSGGYFYRNFDNERCLDFELSASHLFNVFSYFAGYKKSRFVELYTVEGLNYVMTKTEEGIGNALGLHLGLNLDLKLTNKLSFFVETLMMIYTNGVNQSTEFNWRGYELGFNGTLGVKYALDAKSRGDDYLLSILKNAFISLTEGIQSQNSSLVNSKLGIRNSLGQHMSLSFGNWFNYYFAIRLSAFFSNHYWIQYPENPKLPTRYFGGRVEGMTDLLRLFRDDYVSRISVPMFLGAEIGYMNKVDIRRNVNSFYVGLTGGFQIKCRVAEKLSIYMEPRISIVPYSVSHDTVVEDFSTRSNYYDQVYNINLGVEYSF